MTSESLPHVAYFSSTSENTHRFVAKLGFRASRIPLHRRDDGLYMCERYVLIVPTYGGGNNGGAVPKQVIRFLNEPVNREHLLGVIAAGNTNFGAGYCAAGAIIAPKCRVPLLYQFELMGTPDDVVAVREGLLNLWTPQSSPTPA